MADAKELPGPTPGRAEGDPDVKPSREEKRQRGQKTSGDKK
jgi:hypothetical protein